MNISLEEEPAAEDASSEEDLAPNSSIFTRAPDDRHHLKTTGRCKTVDALDPMNTTNMKMRATESARPRKSQEVVGHATSRSLIVLLTYRDYPNQSALPLSLIILSFSTPISPSTFRKNHRSYPLRPSNVLLVHVS